MSSNILALDCTLRDGGFSLEDAEKNKIPHLDFNEKTIANIAGKLVESKVDIIELGAIERTQKDMRKFAIYPSVEAVSNTIPDRSGETLYACFYRGPDISLDEIPDYRDGFCQVARVCLRYSELDKSLDYCRGLQKKGYLVSIQPMVTVRYKEDELNKIIQTANEIDAYALYFVDSYGYMDYQDVEKYLVYYKERLNPTVKIGFHAHNNMHQAYANVISFIDKSGNRDIIVDSCCMGMGQGAGNLQTELILPYLNNRGSEKYRIEPVWAVCDILDPYKGNSLWGYSPLTLIPALQKTAYKYAIVLKTTYGYSYEDIHCMLKLLTVDLKHRYTKTNVEWLIDQYEKIRVEKN